MASKVLSSESAYKSQYDDIVDILEKLTSIIDTQMKGLRILQGATP
jgi:hypothetical protein